MTKLARWWTLRKMYWIGYFCGRVLSEEQVGKLAALKKGRG